MRIKINNKREFPVFDSGTGVMVNLGIGIIPLKEISLWYELIFREKIENWKIIDDDNKSNQAPSV